MAKISLWKIFCLHKGYWCLAGKCDENMINDNDDLLLKPRKKKSLWLRKAKMDFWPFLTYKQLRQNEYELLRTMFYIKVLFTTLIFNSLYWLLFCPVNFVNISGKAFYF